MGKDKKRKGFLKGFKDFISKGNVIDLAVAVIMGAAFGKIVASLVNDIIMPLIAAIFGKPGVDGLSVVINGSNIMYGKFIQTVIDFLIIAFFVYLFIVVLIQGSQKRLAEKLEKRRQKGLPVEEPAPAPIPEDIKLLTEIRDNLQTLNEKLAEKKTK